ncbi:MAG: antibiotic ABC transporter permease, partial [Finegoldia magna]|nr:antibiotic ABC transporter permease [Finegoldia magna]
MLKLLKHDLKNNLKLCLISLLVGLLGNSFLYALFKNSIMTNTQTLGFVEMLFLILCILAVFGSFLALTVQIVMV